MRDIIAFTLLYLGLVFLATVAFLLIGYSAAFTAEFIIMSLASMKTALTANIATIGAYLLSFALPSLLIYMGEKNRSELLSTLGSISLISTFITDALIFTGGLKYIANLSSSSTVLSNLIYAAGFANSLTLLPSLILTSTVLTLAAFGTVFLAECLSKGFSKFGTSRFVPETSANDSSLFFPGSMANVAKDMSHRSGKSPQAALQHFAPAACEKGSPVANAAQNPIQHNHHIGKSAVSYDSGHRSASLSLHR